MTNISFAGLEEHDTNSIICLFETERFGYLQVRLKRMQDKYHGDVVNTWKFETLPQEPDLNMFTDDDLLYMQKNAWIAWRMVHDVPAYKKRFE